MNFNEYKLIILWSFFNSRKFRFSLSEKIYLKITAVEKIKESLYNWKEKEKKKKIPLIKSIWNWSIIKIKISVLCLTNSSPPHSAKKINNLQLCFRHSTKYADKKILFWKLNWIKSLNETNIRFFQNFMNLGMAGDIQLYLKKIKSMI